MLLGHVAKVEFFYRTAQPLESLLGESRRQPMLLGVPEEVIPIEGPAIKEYGRLIITRGKPLLGDGLHGWPLRDERLPFLSELQRE